jgi:NAD(P)-dependent dehydrogenase (short-subunit alcohol dehydrogenase family)
MAYDIDGNSALVTASSSGLGKASATVLAREGANVVVNGRDEDRLADAVAEIEETAEGQVVGHAADLTDADDVEGLVDRAVSEFGGLDHLVTSAGGPPSGAFLEMEDEDWYDAFDLLVMSVVRTVRAAAPHLEDGGGSIVAITSLSVKEAIDSLVLSNSVRMGVIGLEKTLATELAPEVRVNSVLPSTHETPRVEELVGQGVDRGDYDSYEEGLEDWSSGVPLERIGQPEELGEAVAFLCSERASYLNGVALPVDGGSSASNL